MAARLFPGRSGVEGSVLNCTSSRAHSGHVATLGQLPAGAKSGVWAQTRSRQPYMLGAHPSGINCPTSGAGGGCPVGPMTPIAPGCTPARTRHVRRALLRPMLHSGRRIGVGPPIPQLRGCVVSSHQAEKRNSGLAKAGQGAG